MRHLCIAAIASAAFLFSAACSGALRATSPETVIAIERGALDRWGKGDPHGYLEVMAPEVTYFDPRLTARIDGTAPVTETLMPIAGQVHIDRYEMIAPKMQQYGDIIVLTFNFVSHTALAGGADTLVMRWNSTEVYRRSGRDWRIVHSHWSYTTPELKEEVP